MAADCPPEEQRMTKTEETFRYVLLALFAVMMLYGLLTGEFLETWRNGATL